MLSKGNQKIRHKRHGFLKRMDSATGRSVVNRRRSKGRHKLTV
jgi:large subunit ribosomal protein L34